jgi:hypothetical protein
MTDKQIIIEDCPYFIGGNCQEYLDGVCENHKCDLKIIRELETKLKAKEQECEELKKQIKFEFDETLLQYSNTIEDLQKQLKDSVMQKCPQCGETYLNPIGAKLYKALIEIKELVQSDYCTEIGSCEFCAEIGNCLNKKILHKISEVINE